MSGGSYDYLYFQASELGGHKGQLEAMAERLDGLPYAAAAAAATHKLLASLNDEALPEVWKAVEWWDSGDYSEDQVRDAAIKYQERDRRG